MSFATDLLRWCTDASKSRGLQIMRIALHASHWLRAAVLGALLAPLELSYASGFALLEQSASRLGTAFAGTGAAADDATTMFFNPAGLVYLGEAQALLIPSAVEITSEFHDRGSTAGLGQPLGNNGGDAGGWNFVPSAYASTPIGSAEKWAIGIGLNAPFGLKTEYDDGWVGRFQALKSEIKTINVNPTIAYRVSDAVALGFGVSYQRIDAELTNAVNYTPVVLQASGLVVPGLEGDARVEGDDTGWGFNVGAMFELSPATRIGIAYRSSIDYEVAGTATFQPATSASGTVNAIISAVSAPGGPLADGPVVVDLELPDSALVSLYQRIGDRFELLADVAWTGWSSVQELRVVREGGTTLSVTPELWDDTWRFALGGAFAYTSKLKFRAGVAYDQTPVSDATRTPRLPDVNRFWLAIGTHWQQSEMISMDFAYAHLFSDDVPLNQTGGNPLLYGSLVGEQSSDIDIVGVQVNVRF
jgi:long-chain fatty acid transport protein